MFNDVSMFDNFTLFVQLLFFITMITKLLYESDNVIYKKYNHCALSLIYNSKIQKDIKVLQSYFKTI